MTSRRQFMKAGAAGLALLAARRRAWGFSQTAGLQKFLPGWQLQGLGDNGIPVATSGGTVTIGGAKAAHYDINIGAFRQQLHPSMGQTLLWGFGQGNKFRHLGGVIVAQKNLPVHIKFTNLLNGPHPVGDAIDTSEFFMDNQMYGTRRVSVHLHGGFVPWVSDGEPHSWFGPVGEYAGPTYAPNMTTITGHNPPIRNSTGAAEYYWPNQQSSRLMWYHDHAMDQTRINAYGGIATGYILRDDLENLLIRVGAIPSREVPLIFQDKIFQPGGSLWYPSAYEVANLLDASGAIRSSSTSGRWDAAEPLNGKSGIPSPSIVPEFYGDTILCNGTVYPSVPVINRRYRFRILNAFQARFMNLTLWVLPDDLSATELPLRESGLGQPIDPESPDRRYPNPAPDAQRGPVMIQISTEGGFLKQPVTLAANQTIQYDEEGLVSRYNLLLGPAERADVLIDFAGFENKRIVLYNDAPSPFPGGDPRNDYFFGQQDFTDSHSNDYGLSGGLAAPLAGFGPNTRTLLQFNVSPAPVGTPSDMPLATALSTLTSQLRSAFTTLNPQGIPVRELTLNEDFDEWGRLVQRLGTITQTSTASVTPCLANGKTYGRWFADPATETVQEGATEIWRIWNLTGDTHPIHFHLVNVQILARDSFDGLDVPNPLPPVRVDYNRVDDNERGWKETVRINPGECMTVIMKFDLPKVPFAVPQSTRTGGHEYVWHCHILEHEEHDMMRPLVVTPKA